MKQLTVGSLFAGVGGIEKGLEDTGGFKTVWQVEIDEYARRVLAKHWPDVRRWDDVRTFPPDPSDAWQCDLICGGFPCQDISAAGSRLGLAGERSGLWSEMLRVFRLVKPRYVLVENSPEIVNRGMGTVFADLAASGFDAEWRVLAACDFGAPHIRERMFIFGYPSERHSQRRTTKRHQRPTRPSPRFIASDPNNKAAIQKARLHADGTQRDYAVGSAGGDAKQRFGTWCGWKSSTPELCRVDDGVPGRLDRDRVLGNAVVPQVAQWIGERILEVEADRRGLESEQSEE